MHEEGSGLAVGLVGIERFRKLLGDRLIEVELAVFDERHDVGGEDAFGDGSGPSGGVAVHGAVGVFAGETEGFAPDQVAVVQDGELGSGDVLLGEGFAGESRGIGGGDGRATEEVTPCAGAPPRVLAGTSRIVVKRRMEVATVML